MLPSLALTSTAFLFGLSFVVTKFALGSLPPFTLVFLRFFLSWSLLTILSRFLPHPEISATDRVRFALTAMIVPGAYFIAETWGLKWASASSISLLIATVPIFTAFLGFLFLNETIRFLQAIGIALSIMGVAVLVGVKTPDLTSGSRIGVGEIFGLAAAFCAASYLVLARNLMKKYAPFTMTLAQSFFASLIFLPLAAAEQIHHEWRPISFWLVAAILYLAIFCSVLAFFLWNYGISRMEASKAAVFANLVPLFTVFSAALLLGEKISLHHLIGGAMVLSGVMLACRRDAIR